MNKLKIGIPAMAIALSSFALSSCNNKNSNVPVKPEPKTEVVIQQAPDSFEKTNETKETELPPWAKKLIVAVGAISIYAVIHIISEHVVNKLKNDPEGARIYLDMCGDNYLD